ncbi:MULTISPECIES: hypothetical protein [Edwardsiella]|uniref:hypothetical protein n=1 Tax=Edwardsiella TaxID=635 RepID=UPI000B1E53AE|nr:hypothetical protein [Edwardsiella anguillarum]
MKIKRWMLLASLLGGALFAYAVLYSADKVCEHQALFSDFCRRVDISPPTYLNKHFISN